MTEPSYRVAPPGFTKDNWAQFMAEGFLAFEDALSPVEVSLYLDALEELAASDTNHRPDRTFAPGNIAERGGVWADLIDHPRHVGYAYDIYGELLKLHMSQAFMRPTDGSHNIWHPDGARGVPYGVFAPELPLQLKVGYWLTDLPRPKMGNFVYMPGSHKTQYLRGYDTHDSLPGEKVVRLRAGTMTLMHASLWHRVEPNESDVTRKNIFYAYCPSWVCEGDRHRSSPEWLEALGREQRIIMRGYSGAYTRTKPPADDSPLFLDRDTGLASDPEADPTVALHRQKRRTWVEKTMGVPYNGPLSHVFEAGREQIAPREAD